MERSFESQSRDYRDESEVKIDGFEFKSADKKYINQNYKNTGLALGISGPDLGIIKKQANQEKQLPDTQGDLSLDQINFYREHYGFSPLNQEEYDSIQSSYESSTLEESFLETNGPEEHELNEPNTSTSETILTEASPKLDFGPLPEDPYNISTNDVAALNSLFDSDSEQFPEGKYVDIRNWNDWTPLAIGEETKDGVTQFYIYTPNGNKQSIDFDTREDAETELAKMKAPDKQKALDLLKKARNFAIGVDLDTPWKESDSNKISTVDGIEQDAPQNQGISDEAKYDVSQSTPETISDSEAINSDTGTSSNPDLESNKTEVITDINFEALQQELDRLIEVEAQKLQKEETLENPSYSIDREKLERFKEDAKQSISRYQQFASQHSSPLEKSNPQIQERYQLLEKLAWNSLYNLADLLDGEIATLPQDRDIQLSHSGGVDTRQYLEARGYKFDENGDVTHITDNGIEIELNRTMKTESLIKSKRPSHIVYDKSISLDNDINYQGYLIRGLNQQTPDFIIGVLDKNNLENVIVDETKPKTPDAVSSNEIFFSINPYGDKNSARLISSALDNEGNSLFGFNEEQLLSIFNEMGGVPNWDLIIGFDQWGPLIRGEEVNLDTVKRQQIIDKLREYLPIESSEQIPESDTIDSKDETDQESQKLEFEIVEDPDAAKLYEELEPIDLVDRLAQLREQYAEAEEIYNRNRKDKEAEKLFNDSRAEYNEAVERMLKLKIAEGQEANIHQIFKDEVISLRDSRVVQSQELQGTWEKRFNNTKEKLLGWATKNKRTWMVASIILASAGGLLSLTGVGMPVAGALEVTRRSLGSVMSGVGARETLVGLMENRNISIFGRKWQAVIPKLVQESLSTNADDFKKVSDDVLKDRLGTLEAYYRLNGGKFTNNDQQKAYEKILTELGHRVRVNTLENYQNTQESSASAAQTQDSNENQDDLQESVDTSSQDNNSNEVVNSNTETFHFDKSRYTLELLNTISDKRVQELDEFRRKRKIATGTGILVGLVAGGVVNALDEMNNPDSLGVPESGGVRPNLPDAGEGNIPNPSSSPEINPGTTSPSPKLPPTGAGEALSQSAEATRAAAEQLAQDVSNLSPGETIWSEVAKQLGENATDNQIQQAVENLLQSEVGQNSIYELAQGTEGGRDLLAQWGIDNATEMAELSKEQLYEVSKYLAPGELKGITELSLDNITPFDSVEPPQVDVSEAMDAADTSVVEAPTPSVEPTTSVTTDTSPIAPEVSPIAGTEFTRDLSEALGTTNLTEAQLQEAIYSFATSEQGSFELYNQIISNAEGARFLSGFGVNSAADFANLRPDELYEIAQTVGVENLDALPGFELNDIILSKFEDAPDAVELVRGSRPLDIVNRYIASEVGNLPYDSTLGQQVLNTYLDTTDGKQWLYDAIVNNPDVDNQNIQYFKEYLRFKDIKSPEEFVSKFNWSEFSGNKNIPTAAFWNQTRLPNGGVRLQPLSTFLKPSQMTGIKEAVRQVLTR